MIDRIFRPVLPFGLIPQTHIFGVLGWIAGGLSAASGVASFIEGRKAAKSQEEIGEYNSVANLANGRMEGARTRFNAQGAKFQALLQSKDLKVNSLILDRNRKVAKMEGSAKANEFALQATRISRDFSREEADLSRDAFDIARERRSAQTQFQRDLDDIREQKEQQKAQTKAALATMGISVTGGVAQSLDKQLSKETEKAIVAVQNERTIESRALSKMTRLNKERVRRLRIAAEEGSALALLNSELVGELVDAQDVIMELEAANLVRQSEYMSWQSEFIEESAKLEAQVLETGSQIRAVNTQRVASANASSARAAGTIGLISGVGQGFNTISQTIFNAKQ